MLRKAPELRQKKQIQNRPPPEVMRNQTRRPESQF